MSIFSRYLFQKDQFSKNPPRVKPSAFSVGSDGKTSVYETQTLQESEIWNIGTDIGAKNSRNLKGRAQIKKQDITDADLDTEVAEPPPFHRNIIGWEKYEEPMQLIKQQLLANKAQFIEYK